MGKTFWMHAFAEKQSLEDRFKVVLIDYQGVDSTEEFLIRTARELVKSQSLPSQFIDRLGAIFDNVDASVSVGPLQLKKSARASTKTPMEIMNDLLVQLDRDLVGPEKNLKLVIAMDEVPDAVLAIYRKYDAQEAHNLLQRLRYLRSVTQNIRWIIAGSIGFHHALTAIGSSTDVVNNLNNMAFGPLLEPDAEELAKRLALGISRPITPEAISLVIEKTDAIPSLIQKLFDMMRYDRNEILATDQPIQPEEVLQRFEDFVDDRDQSRDVTHFLTRIDLYYGENTALAFTILDFMAQVSDAVLFSDLELKIKNLIGDGFNRKSFIITYSNLCDDHYLFEQKVDDQIEVSWRYPVIRTIYRRNKKIG